MKYLKIYELFSDQRGNDYEVFNYMTLSYDIQKAWELIKKNPKKYCDENGDTYTIPLKEVKKMYTSEINNNDGTKSIKPGVSLNKDYIGNISDDQLNDSGIFINDESIGFDYLIDGWHRAFKKIKNGDKDFNVYLINDPEDIKYIRIR